MTRRLVAVAVVLLCGYMGTGMGQQMTATPGEKLSASLGKLQGKGGQLFFPCGRYEADETVNIQSNGVYLRGSGYCSQIHVTTTRDVFNVTGELFALESFEIVVDPPSARNDGAIVHGNGLQGRISHVRFTGSEKLNNGCVYYTNTQLGGGWFFEDIRMTGGATWRAFLSLTSASDKTVASTVVTGAGGGVFFSDAAYDLNGAIDTLQVSQSDFSLRGGKVFWLRNSVNSPIAPRIVMCSNCVIETRGPGSTAIQLDASRDFAYHGFLAGADLGVVVGRGAANTDLSNIFFMNLLKGAISIAPGAMNTTVKDNFFEDTTNAAPNQYNTISVEPGASNFQISGNTWRSTNRYKAHYAIVLSPGNTSSYSVTNNLIPADTYMAGPASMGATGPGFVVTGNSGIANKSDAK